MLLILFSICFICYVSDVAWYGSTCFHTHREVEAKARAEYEERLQRETEEKARLAEEVKARRAAEERLEQERREYEQETQRRRQVNTNGSDPCTRISHTV